ncbi:hypothetical protein GCM10027415_31710 [Humibacter ginsengisoli]
MFAVRTPPQITFASLTFMSFPDDSRSRRDDRAAVPATPPPSALVGVRAGVPLLHRHGRDG